ncbi:MAG: response regulator [Candidatus Eisenbacteria bacterium]|uniref:histidine kinase n=1 Tax=Eiseniibacteriota bacterium TaxID=2212470 RepID=A0A538SKC9_UNCEI|nr:MAG: response regulator [Candidatus Eisenbacteria bacterium]
MRAWRPPSLRSLRGRIAVLLVLGFTVAAAAFYTLLMLFTRNWLGHELDLRSRALVQRTAEAVEVPLTIGDRAELADLVRRAAQEDDVVGVAVYRGDGTLAAAHVNDMQSWSAAEGEGAVAATARGLSVTPRRLRGTELRILETPVSRYSGASIPSRDEAFGLPEGGAGGGSGRLGWVRVEITTARLESAIATAGRAGLLLLAAVIGLALLASGLLLSVVVRPLGEASQLARAVAAGSLERRLPVGGPDELGTLAESMNTMAAALTESRARERAESEALRDAAEAVVVIAESARGAQDPGTVFRAVASQLRRVTRCTAVALAVPSDESPAPCFEQFEPPPPWGGLALGAQLDEGLAGQLWSPLPVRLVLRGVPHRFAAELSAEGFQAALLVPLALEIGPPAALLLVSTEAGAFTPSQVRVVAGLSSHLASALHVAQMKQRLEGAIEELERTREQLVRTEKLRAAGELASGIAHEFNNVLGAILGRTQLLRHRATHGTLATAELLESFSVMELAARDGAEIVRRLHRFSTGDPGETLEPVDLEAVLRDSISFTRPRWKNEAEAAGRNITVGLDATPGLWVRGQASQLREVFTNLILNAADALPRGGTIRIAAAPREALVAVVVEDDGIGMAPETQRRLFDPFFTTKGPKGAGLGLSVVYGTVERHGGAVAVTSRLGHGTRFEVTLPRVEKTVPPADSPPGAAPPVPTGDVLVVDDEPAVRDLLVEIVRTLGYGAVGCDGAESALARFRPGRFELVLTDIGMPGSSGWQLARELRAADPDVTIALVTGWGHQIGPDQLDGSGVDAVVPKPFSIEDVAKVLELSASRRDGDPGC